MNQSTIISFAGHTGALFGLYAIKISAAGNTWLGTTPNGGWVRTPKKATMDAFMDALKMEEWDVLVDLAESAKMVQP